MCYAAARVSDSRFRSAARLKTDHQLAQEKAVYRRQTCVFSFAYPTPSASSFAVVIPPAAEAPKDSMC